MNQEDTTQWAIIELMGHQKIAGRYSEHGPMHRVDVPDSDSNEFSFTRLYSAYAIYSITFVDEQAARIASKALQPEAITIWEVNHEIKRLSALVQPEEILDQSGIDAETEWYGDDLIMEK